jgi:hypothetical protein
MCLTDGFDSDTSVALAEQDELHNCIDQGGMDAVMSENQRERPERNALPGALAREKEDRAMEQRFPGQYVAYTEEWRDNKLVRTFLAAAKTTEEMGRILSEGSADTLDSLPISILVCR